MVGRREFSVQSRDTTRDTRGTLPATYTEKFKIRGDFERKGRRIAEFSDTGGIRTEGNLIVKTRARDNIDHGDKLVDTETSREFYVIEAPLAEPGRGRFMQIFVSERPAAGT